MTKSISLISLYIALFLALFLISNCEKEPSPTTNYLDQIVITPFSAVIEIDSTIQLSAIALDANGDQMSDISFVWTVYDTNGNINSSIVIVDTSGLVTGLQSGSAIVKASSEEIESNGVTIIVIGNPGWIEVTPLDVMEYNWSKQTVNSQTVAVGKTAKVVGVVKDSSGNEIPETAVSWVVQNPSLASVDETGLITGLSKGITSVKATYDFQFDTLSYTIESDPIKLYVMDEVFSESFSGISIMDTLKGYFISDNNIVWQLNYQLPTDSTDAGPHSGKFQIVEDGGDNVLMLTDPSTAYFANRQILIITYGTGGYYLIDSEHGWPDTTGMKTRQNWRVQFRMKGRDDPAPYTTSESLVIFTHYFSGASSPYYFVYAPGRNRVSTWFGAALAPDARIPLWGSMPEITYDTWFNVVVELFDGTMRTEVFSGPEPSGEWDYSYTNPDYEEGADYIPGLWLGSFLVDTLYIDDIHFYSPY